MRPTTYLYPGLGQTQPLTQLLPHKGVRIVSFIEQPLQFVQLFQREIGPTSSLFDLGRLVIVLRRSLVDAVMLAVRPLGVLVIGQLRISTIGAVGGHGVASVSRVIFAGFAVCAVAVLELGLHRRVGCRLDFRKWTVELRRFDLCPVKE